MKLKAFFWMVIVCFLSVTSITAQNFQQLQVKAKKAFQNGNYKSAYEFYSKAITINPNNPESIAYLFTGKCKELMGDYKGAIAEYSKGIALNSEFNDNYYNDRGYCKYLLNDNKGALMDYDKALKVNPNYLGECYNGGIYYKRALCKEKLGDEDGSLKDYAMQIRQYEEHSDKAHHSSSCKLGKEKLCEDWVKSTQNQAKGHK